MPRNKNKACKTRGPLLKFSTVRVLVFSSAQDHSLRRDSLFRAQYQAKIVNFRIGAVYKQRSKAENNFLPTGTVQGL